MSKTNTFEADNLKLVFQAIPIANLADNAASSPATALYISLHTSDPGEAPALGQSTSETAYTNYARVSVSRDATEWTVTTDGSGVTEVTNAFEISFPQCGATGSTVTHFSVGTAASGAGKVLYKGQLNSPLVVSNGITPKFAAGTLKVRED